MEANNVASQRRTSVSDIVNDSFNKVDQERLSLLNARPSPCTDADWSELIDLGIRERISKRSSWRLVEREPSARELYDDLWQDVKLSLLTATNKTLPKHPAYFDEAFLRKFLRYSAPTKKYGITNVPKKMRKKIHADVASDLLHLNRDSYDDPIEMLQPDAVTSSREIQELAILTSIETWEELRDIRKQASESWNPKKKKWRDHWLPFLYYRAKRVHLLKDAAAVAGISEILALEFEDQAVRALRNTSPAHEKGDEFAPDIQADDFPSALQTVVASPGSLDAFQFAEWVGLRCDPIDDRINNPSATLEMILCRKHLKSTISRFEKDVANPVRIRRHLEDSL